MVETGQVQKDAQKGENLDPPEKRDLISKIFSFGGMVAALGIAFAAYGVGYSNGSRLLPIEKLAEFNRGAAQANDFNEKALSGLKSKNIELQDAIDDFETSTPLLIASAKKEGREEGIASVDGAVRVEKNKVIAAQEKQIANHAVAILQLERSANDLKRRFEGNIADLNQQLSTANAATDRARRELAQNRVEAENTRTKLMALIANLERQAKKPSIGPSKVVQEDVKNSNCLPNGKIIPISENWDDVTCSGDFIITTDIKVSARPNQIGVSVDGSVVPIRQGNKKTFPNGCVVEGVKIPRRGFDAKLRVQCP